MWWYLDARSAESRDIFVFYMFVQTETSVPLDAPASIASPVDAQRGRITVIAHIDVCVYRAGLFACCAMSCSRKRVEVSISEYVSRVRVTKRGSDVASTTNYVMGHLDLLFRTLLFAFRVPIAGQIIAARFAVLETHVADTEIMEALLILDIAARVLAVSIGHRNGGGGDRRSLTEQPVWKCLAAPTYTRASPLPMVYTISASSSCTGSRSKVITDGGYLIAIISSTCV